MAKSQEGLQQFFGFFHESQVTLAELARRWRKKSGSSGPLYKPHKAGPRPMGKRYFICQDCDNLPDCPMLEDEVWYKIASRSDLLCIHCTEVRLGRPLEVTDLRDCPGNAFTFLLHDRLLWDQSGGIMEESDKGGP